MTTIFPCRRRAERFAQLLDEANGGRRHHTRSRIDPELAQLVALSQQVTSMQQSAEVDPEFRTNLRELLMAQAERERVDAGTAQAAVPEPVGASAAQPAPVDDPVEVRLISTLRGPRTRVRARGAIILGVAAGAIAVSGISAASEDAVPGDALYGMKRSTERAQLALASSDLSRGQLFLDFARTRLAEAEAVRGDSGGFASVLDDMDTDTRHGVKLLTTSAVYRGDLAALDAINAFLTTQRSQVAALFDGASHPQQGRATESVNLLDAIRRRSDALRAALACEVGPSGRSDNLGPIPRTCPVSKGSAIGGQPGTARDEQSGGRPASPNSVDSIDPLLPADPPVSSDIDGDSGNEKPSDLTGSAEPQPGE